MQFVRTVYQSVVNSIWDHVVQDGHVVAEDTITTQKRAVEVYRKHLLDMEQKKVPVKEFVYSRGLTNAPEKYKNKATPHVQVSRGYGPFGSVVEIFVQTHHPEEIRVCST